MKKRFWLGLLFLCGGLVYGADTKLEDMAEDTSPTSDDIIYVVDDPLGTPADKKVTFANVQQLVAPVLTEDTTVDFTSTDTLAEMQALIDAVPKNLGGYFVYFDFADGTYNSSMDTAYLTFANFYNGVVYIRGNTGESGLHTNQAVVLDFSAGTKGLYIASCVATVYINNLAVKISNTSGTECIDVNACQYVAINGCYLYGAALTTNTTAGVYARVGGTVKVKNTYVSLVYRGLWISELAMCLSDTNDDTGTEPVYGLATKEYGHIGKLSTQPDGSTANESATAPGIIE